MMDENITFHVQYPWIRYLLISKIIEVDSIVQL